MKIATMNVSAAGFRCPKENRSRIALALKILEFAQRNKISCLCFPSGVLITSRISQITPLLVPITEKARKLRISLVLGVDLLGIFRLSSHANAPDFLDAVEKQKVPCLLASYNHRKHDLLVTRQRSCTGEHARRGLVPDDIMNTPRIMNLGGVCFQVIHCGEVYDSRLFSSGMPRAGVIFGHLTMPRLSRTMRIRSEQGFSLVNSEHRIGHGGKLFCHDRGMDKTRGDGFVVEHNGLWAEMGVWELSDKMRFKPIFRVNA
jgi:hypothetical protein